MADQRDPRIYDKGLRIIQAKSLDNTKVIATIVNWDNHPEVTLGFSPRTNPEECRRARINPCASRGKYFSGGI